MGVVTLNLADVGLSANKNVDKFWEIMNERAELVHKALQCRYKRIKSITADTAPILWQYGAFARLGKGEPIDELLKHGRFTISFGYAGLYECVKAMFGVSHTDPQGKDFALQVMQFILDKCNQWKEEEDIDYSPYGSPIENTTYKFAKTLKQRFGEDVFVKLDGKDRDFITNSYHIFVEEEIDPFTKLKLESEFQKLSSGGAISYIECANLTDNIDAVLTVVKFIYNNIMYAELNTKSDYCQKCGYDKEIECVTDNGEYVWRCPNCGNTDKKTLNVSRRSCGYIGTNFWSKGRTDEIIHRFVHLDNHNKKES